MNIKFISAVSFSLLSLFVLASCNNNSTDTTEPKEYTITWKNYDGNILLVDEVLEGELPVYNGKEPFKEGNDQYSYTFSGWTPLVIKAYSDATYTATFNEVINTYQVVWKNYDGSVLEIDNNVPYNTLPTYDGETPLKPKSVEYSYSFDGWDKKILPVKENTEYVAKFKETINKYTITFETFDGSKVNSITADYGTLINEPEDKPILENYRFVGWCIDEDLTTAVTWPYKLVGDVTFYASYNEKVNIGQYLKSLLEGYSYNPLSKIPQSLLPSYEANLINQGQLDFDYTNFVNTNLILDYGYGEQWKMVVDNLNQSTIFFNVLSAIDLVSSASITAFNNYLDKNPSSTVEYSFEVGVYKVDISFDGTLMIYVLEFDTTIPLIGETKVQIGLELNVNTGERVGRIQLNDANALKYVINGDSYTFAIRYGGVRRAYFNMIVNEDASISGSIYEYLGIDGSISTSSAAEFYINEDYTTVIGNKAGALAGFDGVICEVYNTNTGHLIGYEVNEHLSALGTETETPSFAFAKGVSEGEDNFLAAYNWEYTSAGYLKAIGAEQIGTGRDLYLTVDTFFYDEANKRNYVLALDTLPEKGASTEWLRNKAAYEFDIKASFGKDSITIIARNTPQIQSNGYFKKANGTMDVNPAANEPLIINEWVDASLLVVKQNEATLPLINETITRIVQSRNNLIGCIYNSSVADISKNQKIYGYRYGYNRYNRR